MCTAATVVCGDRYFGRNLDFEHTFGEKICITPRNFPFSFTNGEHLSNHYAMMGVAVPEKGYPLYFDAVNEKGLSMAGLNFPGFAHYFRGIQGKCNVASFELVAYILSQCSNTESAVRIFENINITDTPFSPKLSPTPLHWIITDKTSSVVLEQTKDGVKIFENPVGILTNSPPFDMQMLNLNNYISVTSEEPKNRFSSFVNLSPYSRGMGAIGLPGDNSSMSRFVRAGFILLNSEFGKSEEDKVSQFFHILYSVHQQKGCVKVNGKNEITNYSVCANADRGVYYFTTHDNFTIHAASMHKENLDGDRLISYCLYNENKIISIN